MTVTATVRVTVRVTDVGLVIGLGTRSRRTAGPRRIGLGLRVRVRYRVGHRGPEEDGVRVKG